MASNPRPPTGPPSTYMYMLRKEMAELRGGAMSHPIGMSSETIVKMAIYALELPTCIRCAKIETCKRRRDFNGLTCKEHEWSDRFRNASDDYTTAIVLGSLSE